MRHRVVERVDAATVERWGHDATKIDAGIRAEIRAALAMGRVTRYPPRWAAEQACNDDPGHRRLYVRDSTDERAWVLKAHMKYLAVVTVLSRPVRHDAAVQVRTGFVRA